MDDLIAREYTGWRGAVEPTNPPSLAVLVHGERLWLMPVADPARWVSIVLRDGVAVAWYGIPSLHGQPVKPALYRGDVLLANILQRSFQYLIQHRDIEGIHP